MILEQKQSKRFYKLFDYLVGYVARKNGTFAQLIDARGRPIDDEVYRAALTIWGEDGDRSLIQDFVSENPAHLNRSDLRDIASWESAICDRFAIVRIGRDVLFLHGEHAFAVRGLSREIDDVTGPLPTFAEGIIMPFDGLITYGTALTSYPLQIGANMRLSLTEEAAECCATGKLARTARQFMEMAPVAAQNALQSKIDDFTYRTELEMNANELGEDQHEGVLAGLDWDARNEAIKQYTRDNIEFTESILQHQFDDWCDSGKHAETLADAFGYLTRKELVAFAKSYGVRRGLSKLNKSQIIDEIVYTIENDGPLFVEMARLDGLNSLKALRRACLGGGKVEYPDHDLSRLDDVPFPSFPAMLLYHDRAKGIYTLVVPREVCEALEECDWDAEIADAEATEAIIRKVETLVDFRGVVTFEDVINELEEEMSDIVYPFSMLTTMQKRAMRQTAGFDIAHVDEDIYFLFPGISEDAGVRRDGTLDIPDVVWEIERQQAAKPQRHLADMGDGDVMDWMCGRESTRALATYLDAHVPDGCDDYFFADAIVEDVIYEARDYADINYILNRLEQEGFIPTEAQLNRLLELIQAVVNDTPKWTNNGWAPSEL